LARFGDILAKEFIKTVPANIAGQTVNKTQGEILAQVMMKNAITTKQASHIALLLKFMEAHESPPRRA
jgi:pyrroloquinoline quinone (PQQ) biosynthesis protein C